MLRIARNRALQIGGRWRIIFLETLTRTPHTNNGTQERMLRLLTLAAQMGAETAHITANNAEDAATRILEEEKNQIALLIVGSTEHTPVFQIRRTLSETIAGSAYKKRIPVEVVQVSGHYSYSLLERFSLLRFEHFVYALCSVAVAYIAALGLRYASWQLLRINTQKIGLVFMIACAFSAGRFGLIPGLVASLTSFFAIN